MDTKPKFQDYLVATMAFYAKYQGWQSFNPKNKITVKCVKRLESKGFLELSLDTNQARHTGKTSCLSI